MAHPLRIQRKRTKGYRLPAGAVYVGRPTKWGNPFVVSKKKPELPTWTSTLVTAAGADPKKLRWIGGPAYKLAVQHFRAYLEQTEEGRALAQAARRELRGKVLACWCPLDQPCHADVLAEIANGETS